MGDTTKQTTPTSLAADTSDGAAITLDLTGLKCPLPVLKARRQLRDMTDGERLDVRADDPAAPLDFEHFCETAGHRLIETITDAGVFTFCIVKAAGD